MEGAAEGSDRGEFLTRFAQRMREFTMRVTRRAGKRWVPEREVVDGTEDSQADADATVIQKVASVDGFVCNQESPSAKASRGGMSGSTPMAGYKSCGMTLRASQKCPSGGL